MDHVLINKITIRYHFYLFKRQQKKKKKCYIFSYYADGVSGDYFYFLFNVFLIELGNDLIHPTAFKLHNNYDHDKNWMHFFTWF